MTARAKFLQALRAAENTSQNPILLGGPTDDDRESARLLRNGLAVTSFCNFEGFISDRLRELSSWLNTQDLPGAFFPDSLREAPIKRAPSILAALIGRTESGSTLVSAAMRELGAAWSSPSGGGWTLPHVALLWPGSNLSSEMIMQILSAFGVSSGWASLSAVSKAAGFGVQATNESFQSIAERRHKAAHDSTFDVDIVLLRNTPEQLRSLGFAFDALLTSAAQQIASGGVSISGKESVKQHALVQDSADKNLWSHRIGHATDPNALVTKENGTEEEVGTKVRGQLTEKGASLIVRRWEDERLIVSGWFSTGV